MILFVTNTCSNRLLAMPTFGIHLGLFDSGRQLHSAESSQVCSLLQFQYVSETPLCLHGRWLTFVGVSVGTDLVFALLPIPMVWKVQMNRKLRIAVVGILSLGILYVNYCVLTEIGLTRVQVLPLPLLLRSLS